MRHYFISVLENIFIIEDANLSVLPTIATIDNNTYCYHPDLVAYVRCIETDTFHNSSILENRTTLGSSEFCLDPTGQWYLVCLPLQPLFQVSVVWSTEITEQ